MTKIENNDSITVSVVEPFHPILADELSVGNKARYALAPGWTYESLDSPHAGVLRCPVVKGRGDILFQVPAPLSLLNFLYQHKYIKFAIHTLVQ